MAFTSEQVEEFIAALHQDAELRERVRGAILADDFQALPGLVRTPGERMDALTQRVDALAVRVDALTERLDAPQNGSRNSPHRTVNRSTFSGFAPAHRSNRSAA